MKTYSELQENFGVVSSSSKSEILRLWVDLAQEENNALSLQGTGLTVQKNVASQSSFWNEQELKMNFFAPFFAWTKFKNFNVFYERKFSVSIGDEKISCRPDFIFAEKSLDTVVAPVYLVGEIKPNINPEFQLIKAMCIVRDSHPIANRYCLGVSVLGSLFKFYVLEGNEYFSTSSYDATKLDDYRMICAFFLTCKDLFD